MQPKSTRSAKIASIKQSNLSVTEYFNAMRGLWLELDDYQNFRMKSSNDAVMLQKFVERERIFEFLEGLNAEF